MAHSNGCRLVWILLLGLCLFEKTIFADEIADAKARLNRQVQLTQAIAPYVDRPYLARLYMLRSASKSVLDSIEKNGLAHKITFQEYQKLIVAYRYSVSFFKEIESEDTEKWCIELLKINEEIVKAHGFDDRPYTQITVSVYTQLEKLRDDLSKLSLSDELKIKLANLKPLLGEVLAKAQAEGGDRRLIYPVSERAYRAVVELYPDFNAISSSEAAFEKTLEIQGLNEFYGEFAEFNPSSK